MQKKHRYSVRILLAGAIAGLMPDLAQACSPYMCWGSGLVPGDEATVPANLPALAWVPGLGEYSDEPFVIRRANTNLSFSEENIAINRDRYVLVRPEDLRPGDSLEIRAPETCRWGPRGTPATLQVGPPADLPETLGQLEVTEDSIGPITIGSSIGSCSTETTARQLVLTLQPSEEAQPWLDAMIFRTLVDGEPYRPSPSIGESPPFGATWAGRGRDRLYLDCNETGVGFPGVTEGAHTVVFEARIPGTDTVLTSEPLDVTLRCTVAPTEPEEELSQEEPDAASTVNPSEDRDDEDSPSRCAASPSGENRLLALMGLLLVARIYGFRNRGNRSS